MTSYIPAFISRRFSRPSAGSERPAIHDSLDQTTFLPHASEESTRAGTEQDSQTQNAALDRALAGEEESDVLSSMSISTPSENDLRRIDRDRIAQTVNLGASSGDGTRNRGITDPLPRAVPTRFAGEDLRRSSWQSRMRYSHRSLSGSVPNSTNSEMGAAGYVDDPSYSRSVRASMSSTLDMSPSTPGTPEPGARGALLLPEDDGMRSMRDRIQMVQAMDITPEEKSRMMHVLMTERYTNLSGKGHREYLRDGGLGRSVSPAAGSLRSTRSQDVPLTPKSEQSGFMEGLVGPNGETMASPSTSVFTTQSEIEWSLTAEDLKPTHYSKLLDPQPQSSASTGANPSEPDLGDEDLFDSSAQEEKPLGCAHYMRNVKLQCSTCSRWYTCRFCHDEVEDHELVRRKTRNMLCMFCGTAQPAAPICRSCDEEAANYYCDVCKLWDNDPRKAIYHCDDCGICRVGQGAGKDFFHCKVCDVCISMSIRDSHKCIERSVDCDCPICGEYMFTSPQTVVFMRCGHSIHHSCYKQHLETSFKCPICAKSIMNMDITFRHLDHSIASQPMPDDFRDTKALVVCNDCRGKSNVPYHWLGLKCGECDSYNTAQLRIIGPNERAEVPAEDAALEDPVSGAVTPGPASGHQTGIHTPRGRAESGMLLVSRSRRPTSTSAIQDTRASLASDYFYPITNNGRSLSAMGPGRVRSERRNLNPGGDSMDIDDEDELDFWGGDLSPRLRAYQRAQMDDADRDSDSSDDEMEGLEDLDDDDDEDDEEQHGAMDDLELLGHR